MPSRRPGLLFPARLIAERASQAMDAVYERLVREEDRLIALFDPPFDKGSLQPGYIKGYVPGYPGERRPIHACRHMGRLGGCITG